MAQPVLESVTAVTNTAAGTSHSVSLASGVAAGNRSVIIMGLSENGTGFPGFPAGWTQRFEAVGADEDRRLVVYERIFVGGDPTSITVTTSGSVATTYRSYRISGHDAGAPVYASASSNASDGSPDPAAVSGWTGSRDILTIAAQTWYNSGDAVTTTGFPAGYGSTGSNDGGQDSGSLATASLGEDAQTTENPGAFTLSASDFWLACSVAVLGASGTVYTNSAAVAAVGTVSTLGIIKSAPYTPVIFVAKVA